MTAWFEGGMAVPPRTPPTPPKHVTGQCPRDQTSGSPEITGVSQPERRHGSRVSDP